MYMVYIAGLIFLSRCPAQIYAYIITQSELPLSRLSYLEPERKTSPVEKKPSVWINPDGLYWSG